MKKKVLMMMLTFALCVTASAQCTVFLLKDGEHGDYTAKTASGKFDEIDAQAAEGIGKLLCLQSETLRSYIQEALSGAASPLP